ncbi:hypothetical protein PIB30_095033 [Stylosanthes scabra]|uniref:Uncharacterized protein n=1 Tax=Stylosanthes scabra TaxID=79078 RepID=A0ABU6SY15_9FABA|nr:hypothetical protein [Stylosanthes scabra]
MFWIDLGGLKLHDGPRSLAAACFATSFLVTISASLNAIASAANGEEQNLIEVEAVSRFPSWSLNTSASDPLLEIKEKDASVLHLVQSLIGGRQVFRN